MQILICFAEFGIAEIPAEKFWKRSIPSHID